MTKKPITLQEGVTVNVGNMGGSMTMDATQETTNIQTTDVLNENTLEAIQEAEATAIAMATGNEAVTIIIVVLIVLAVIYLIAAYFKNLPPMDTLRRQGYLKPL